MSCACSEELFFIFKAINNREIPSNNVEIQIHIQARVLASLLSDTAIIIAKTNKNIHNQTIHHHRGCCSLLFIQNMISIIPLAKAQRAKIQIIMVHTR